MRNKLVIAVLFFVFAGFLHARPDSRTNMALKAKPSGFENSPAACDNNFSTFAESKTYSDKKFYLDFDFGCKMYVREIKIYFDKDNFPTFFSVERNIDGYTTSMIDAKVITATYPVKNNLIEVTISGGDIAAQYIRLIFNPKLIKGSSMRVAEVAVYADMDKWPLAKIEKQPFVTDTEAAAFFRSELEFKGKVFLQGAQNESAEKQTVFVAKSHSVLFHNLKPGTKYDYSFWFMDFNGNVDQTSTASFTTLEKNLVKGVPVQGTFIGQDPDNKEAKGSKDSLRLANDGDDSYFKSMVTSEDLTKADQYLIFDLGKKSVLNRIVVYWRALAYSEDYQIEVSEDAVNWKSIVKNIDASAGFREFSIDGSPMMIMQNELGNTQARYIRLSVLKNSAFHTIDRNWKIVQIHEVKIF